MCMTVGRPVSPHVFADTEKAKGAYRQAESAIREEGGRGGMKTGEVLLVYDVV